ncbi:MAG: DNA-directed RNA polymerase subunit beta, partial [Planctomycetaceae bacterium]|nr:DNA-directed RNA polymerase subunit beta [Planctomycetaceae bacterium]
MPNPAERIIPTNEVRNFGKLECDFELSDLTRIQTESYARFLQYGKGPGERKPEGLEEVLQEIFPIESYDGQYRLEYTRYELGKPRYTPDECRQLRLTYGRPFRVWLRLVKEQPIEEEVYLGDFPIMLGGGEFIINGAERVIVSQLHRSPGVDFVMSSEPGESKKNYSCRVIPERGSWIEVLISKKETAQVRIDQSGKFSAMTLLRAMAPENSTDADLVKLFYATSEVKIPKTKSCEDKVLNKFAAQDIIYPTGHEKCGEIICDCGSPISASMVEEIDQSGLSAIEIIDEVKDEMVLNSIKEDVTSSHEEALLKIYQRLRPGTPPQLEKATELFKEKFYDLNRYRLGRVGRFRINRKFNQDIPDTEMTLRPEDFTNALRYIVHLRIGSGEAWIDDIDNLGNRRLRTIDELAVDEIRKGFLK